MRVRNDTIATRMRRPPLVLTFLFILLLALGTTGGAVMSMLRPDIQRYSAERIFAAPEVHSLSGSREYDTEVVGDLVFSVEAGLSFFHTHAEGMGVVLLFAATTVVSLVGRRRLRLALSWLFGLSFLFPIGYLAYSAFVLRYGKDSGIALAERALLIPFGSSAILGVGLLIGAVGFLFVNGRLRGRPSARGAPAVGEDSGGWRRPPRLVVLAAALLITLAEIGGASMARFKPEITSFVTARMLERPGVHGLVGVKDVDAEVLEEALVKLDGGLRLFHLHGEGMGLVIFWVGLVLSSVVAAWWLRTTLYALLTLGGFGFPFGYFLSSALIPFVGVGSARAISAALVLLPFGGMVLIALWVLTLLLGRDLVAAAWRLQGRARVGAFPSPGPLPLGERETSDPRPSGERVKGEGAADGAARSAMDLPPLPVILASLLILLLAEVGGGLMVKFKLSLDRANRERIEARSEVHRLVGVREVDGPVIDKLLSRADFALRLFHLHGEGMGLVIFAGGVMVRNFLDSRVLSGVLYAMLAGGGLLYPFGYLAWSGMIPLVGLDRSKDLAEHFVWVPFGGAALAAMGVISLLLGRDLYASWRGKGG